MDGAGRKALEKFKTFGSLQSSILFVHAILLASLPTEKLKNNGAKII